MYKLSPAQLRALRASLRPETWADRVKTAEDQAAILDAIDKLRAEGATEDEALAKVGAGWHPSTYQGRRRRFTAAGVEGLINKRPGFVAKKLTPDVKLAICMARRVDPQVSTERIIEAVSAQFGVTLGESTVRAVLHEAGLSRPPGGGAKKEPVTEELQFAGAAFIQLADLGLGASAGLAERIVELARGAPEPEPDAELRDEQAGRMEQGRFGPEYNQARAKGEAKLGSAFRSVEEQRLEVDLRKRKLVHESVETVQRKVQAAIALPLLTEAGRTTQLDDYRGGHGIAEFCGVRYTGDTIEAKQVSRAKVP